MAQDDFLQFQERVKQAESRGQRYGKDGKLLTSPKGAQGEMQVMPGTQADPGFGVTPAKPGDAEDIARVGRDYLAAMDKRYGGNRVYAAVAYNWGPGNADKWIAKGADFSKLPAETQAYVQAVTGEAPKVSQAVAQAPSPKTTPAADMGVGYQAALALSFLDDKDNEDDDEKAVAKLDEEEDTQAAKMLAEYKPYNALADLDLTSTAPKQFQKGGEAKTEDVPTPMLFSVPTYAETVSHEMYPGQGGQFDQKDAARHMLAAGTLARKYGENAAEMLGNLHEIKTSPFKWIGSKLGISQMPVDYEQDLHNNRVGIELAKRSKSQKDLEDLINAEAERAKSQQTPGAAWVGKPVRRADGSPETGERPLTAEEIEAASKPAFLTPKSGIGRKISTKPGQIEAAVAQGVSETPYNLVGAPVDIATMAMRPFGYSVEKPVMGSDWIKEKMSAAGVRPQPPSDPTSRAFYEAGQLGGGVINPAAPVRGAVAAGQKTGEAAKMLARDFQTYNQQLAVPGASYAVRTRGGPLLYTDQRLASDWSHVNRPLDIPPGFIDPVTAFITPIADVPDKALKEWAQSKLGAYMRRDMGSPEDQFVKAADEGKRLHFMDKPDKTYTDEDVQAYIGWATRHMRDRQGFTPEGEALTKYGKMVEARIDLPIEPVSAESLLESFSAAREIPPQMLQHAKDYPYTTFYGLDVSLPGRLGLDTLVNSMYKARNSAPEFSAYGQPNVTIPERYRFTDATLQGLTPAQASERLAQSQSWFNDVRQKMASAAVKENKQLISKEYDNGSKWASFPDLAEHPDMLDMVKDVGCDGGWCTRGSDYALRYGSEEGKRLNVLFDAKARPKAQITLQTQAGTPNDFISNLTGKDYDNFLNRYPDVAKILENDAPASPWQFDAMLDDVALTPEYQAWASRQGAKITEIKGVNNTADLRKAPYLGEIHDFVKRTDKQYGLQAVDNLDGIGMVDLDSGLNMASPTWSAIFEAAGKQLPNGLVNQIIQRANTLNGGSNYAAVDEIRDLMKRATTEVLEREGHATGGMIERRIDDTRRYL